MKLQDACSLEWKLWQIESSLDYKEIKPVNPKGNQPLIFTGRTDAEAEAPILWPTDVKRQLIGKDSDAGRDWGQEEKGAGKRGWDVYVGTVHNFFGLVSPQQRFEMTGQYYNTVTVQNSIW